MKSEPLISILLPSWNTRIHTLAFLNAILDQDYPLKKMEVIVVDNGSQDDSVRAMSDWAGGDLPRQLKAIKVLELPKNKGIATAYNLAYEHCDPEAEAVIRGESDVVWQRDLVRKLVETLNQYPNAGVVGARGGIYGRNEEIDHAARYINWWTGNMSNTTPDEVVPCDCVFGPTFIIRRECLAALPYFFNEDRFFADELAFSTRIKMAGFDVLYNPEARAFHKVAGTTSQIASYRFEYIAYFEKYLLFLELNAWYRNITLFGYAALFALLKRKPVIIEAMGNALRQHFSGRVVLAPHQKFGMSVPDWLADASPHTKR